jgi:hypothetical protein
MTSARTRRMDRLEETAALRQAGEAALAFGLTDEETTELIRDTRRMLLRHRAGLPVNLDWILDETTAEFALTPDERANLEVEFRALLAEQAEKESR